MIPLWLLLGSIGAVIVDAILDEEDTDDEPRASRAERREAFLRAKEAERRARREARDKGGEEKAS